MVNLRKWNLTHLLSSKLGFDNGNRGKGKHMVNLRKCDFIQCVQQKRFPLFPRMFGFFRELDRAGSIPERASIVDLSGAPT